MKAVRARLGSGRDPWAAFAGSLDGAEHASVEDTDEHLGAGDVVLDDHRAVELARGGERGRELGAGLDDADTDRAAFVGRLDDDGIAQSERGHRRARGQVHRPVPWADCSDNAQRFGQIYRALQRALEAPADQSVK